jgi:hypothetical protein
LLQTKVAAVGQTLPVSGMQVRVFSLATGLPLTLGVDSDGKPVSTILTNRKGEFEVYLPAEATNANVRVVAATKLPGNRALRYDLITPANQVAELDEDTQLLGLYMLETYTSRIRYLMERDAAGLDQAFGILPGANIAQARARIVQLQNGLKRFSKEEREKRYLAAAQLMLSAKKASIFDVQPQDDLGYYGADRLARLKSLFANEKTAIGVTRSVMRKVRLAVAARLAYVQEHDADPRSRYRLHPEAYLDNLPVVEAYRQLRASSKLARPAPKFQILNATDFNLFVVRAYLSNDVTGCLDPQATCDPFDPNGQTLSEKWKVDGIARLLEGAPPEPHKDPLPSNLTSLLIAMPSPADPPQLGAQYTGVGALPQGVALERDLSWGLSYGTRSISLQLLVSFLFTDPASMDDSERQFQANIDKLLGGP